MKMPLFAFTYFKEVIVATPNLTIIMIVKLSSCSSFEMTFFVHIRFPSVATASCSSASRPFLPSEEER